MIDANRVTYLRRKLRLDDLWQAPRQATRARVDTPSE
jgi:hypothetical protein